MSLYIDTSALAKCYIREARSLDVLELLEERGNLAISPLTTVEFRCLLARRRRLGEIDAALESAAQAEFDRHVGGSALHLLPWPAALFADARAMIEGLPAIPLRTLDALHLAVARHGGATDFATADQHRAEAARALGFITHTFF